MYSAKSTIMYIRPDTKYEPLDPLPDPENPITETFHLPFSTQHAIATLVTTTFNDILYTYITPDLYDRDFPIPFQFQPLIKLNSPATTITTKTTTSTAPVAAETKTSKSKTKTHPAKVITTETTTVNISIRAWLDFLDICYDGTEDRVQTVEIPWQTFDTILQYNKPVSDAQLMNALVRLCGFTGDRVRVLRHRDQMIEMNKVLNRFINEDYTGRLLYINELKKTVVQGGDGNTEKGEKKEEKKEECKEEEVVDDAVKEDEGKDVKSLEALKEVNDLLCERMVIAGDGLLQDLQEILQPKEASTSTSTDSDDMDKMNEKIRLQVEKKMNRDKTQLKNLKSSLAHAQSSMEKLSKTLTSLEKSRDECTSTSTSTGIMSHLKTKVEDDSTKLDQDKGKENVSEKGKDVEK